MRRLSLVLVSVGNAGGDRRAGTGSAEIIANALGDQNHRPDEATRFICTRHRHGRGGVVKSGVVSENDLQSFRDTITQATAMPGVNAKGDFWFAVLPPVSAANAAPATPLPLDNVAGLANCLIVPLADPTAFANYLNGQGKVSGVVCGNNALITDDKTLLQTTGITFDLTLHTKREIALVVQITKNPFGLPEAVQNAPPQILEKITEAVLNYQRNLQQAELGLAMVGGDLSVEYYLLPTRGERWSIAWRISMMPGRRWNMPAICRRDWPIAAQAARCWMACRGQRVSCWISPPLSSRCFCPRSKARASVKAWRR